MKRGQKITPKEHERIEEGRWTPGMVGSAALALYANEQFGSEWKQRTFAAVSLTSGSTAPGDIVVDI